VAAAAAAALRDSSAKLHFTHGELTCLSELPRLLRFLRRTGAEWSLATNGRFFSTPANAKTFQRAGLREALVSLHGLQETHESITGTQGFRQTVEGIANLIRAGVRVEVSTVVTEPLVREVDPAEFAGFLTSLGLEGMTLRGPGSKQEVEEGMTPPLSAAEPWACRFAAAAHPLFVRIKNLPGLRLQPGHLVFSPGRILKDFDLTHCPYRRRTRRLPCGPEGLIVNNQGRSRLWKCRRRGAEEPLLLDAKLNHGQVWFATDDGPRPLLLSAECADCPRLHECPACFEISGTGHPPELNQKECAGETPQETNFQCLVREIWLVARNATPPARPFPDEPVRALRRFRKEGLVPLAYSLPAPTRRSPFKARLGSRSDAGRFHAQHHEGVSLQVTESCMCRCVMCNIVGYFKRPLMPLPEILGILEQCGLLGVRLADLFGGEVTLRKDLFSLIRCVRRLGMDCMFITTGYYVTPAFVRKLKEAGINRVVVSIDGSRPEIHDPIRQLPGIYDRAVRAMKCLAAEPSIETFASTVILSENLNDLPDLVRLSGRVGIRKHEFFLPITGPVSSTTPRWPDPYEMELLLDEVIPAVEKAASDCGVSTDFRPELRGWNMPREEAVEMVSSGNYNVHAREAGKRCLAPGWNLFITVNGNVYPCDMPSIISRESALGNLQESSLLEVVTSSEMVRFAEEAGHYKACRMCVGRYEAVDDGGGQ